MPSPIEMQQMQMAQRMGNGATVGGMQPMQGSPPPPAMGQQPPTGAPTQSQAQPLLDQVLDIIVMGNPADLQALGEFFAKVQQLVQEHETGQGMGTNAPAMGTPPAQATPVGRNF